MKQKDIILIIVVIIISTVVSVVLCNMIISSPKNRQQKAEVVDQISSDFKQPDAKYFNSNTVDPTQTIQIGDTSNPQPFNGNGQ